MEVRNYLRRWPPVALVIAAAVLLSGCFGGSDEPETNAGGEPSIVQAGAPGEPSRELSSEELKAIEDVEHTQADVDFMRGMIHHHAQALVMTSLVRDRAAGRKLPLLARRTEVSQQSEIELMETWLKERGERLPTDEEHKHDHGGDGSLMPGMVSAKDLDRLAQAEGAEFNARFLEHMIGHHRGALTMVQELHAADGGAEPDIGSFVRHVEADQGIEIARMQDLLAELQRKPPRADAPRQAKPDRAASASATRFVFAGGKPRICKLG